jgi:hypothetical protein
MAGAPNEALSRLRVSFYATAEVDRWKRYINEGHFDEDTDAADDGVSASFCALPNPVKEGARYVTGNFHPCGRGSPREVHWEISVRPCVDDEAPAALARPSERVGGVEGVLASIRDLWPGSPEVEIEATATFKIAGLGIQPPVPVAPAPDVQRDHDGQKLSLKREAVAQIWKVDPPVGIVSEVTFTIVGTEMQTAIVSGKLTTTVASTMLDTVEEELWRSLQAFRST